MSLRSTTIANANNRHRFVTAELARPYLHNRMRKNLQREARLAGDALDTAIRMPRYGTDACVARSHAIRDAADWIVDVAERLAAFPPPGEAARGPVNAYEPMIDRLAAD